MPYRGIAGADHTRRSRDRPSAGRGQPRDQHGRQHRRDRAAVGQPARRHGALQHPGHRTRHRRIEFSFDGKSCSASARRPSASSSTWATCLGVRTLTAVAFDAAGTEVARDELAINSGAHRFEIAWSSRARGAPTPAACAPRPTSSCPRPSVEKVEFYLNETLLATLFQPPWEHPILLPVGRDLGYVRAVAYQPDGNSTEDLVFINAPDYLEEVDVQFVELYITVLNKEKRPVTGLEQADFQISRTACRRARCASTWSPTCRSTPASWSMSRLRWRTTSSRQGGGPGLLRGGDRPEGPGTLITFNDHPNLAVKFTNEIDELAGGLAGSRPSAARRSTTASSSRSTTSTASRGSAP